MSDLHDHSHDHLEHGEERSGCTHSGDLHIQHDTVHDHGHAHHPIETGVFAKRPRAKIRSYKDRAFTVGIGGPVGSGKTALMLQLCKRMRDMYNLCAITNDIFTQEDGDFLIRHDALDRDRIRAVETGSCPHAAIREDITMNLLACEELTAQHGCELLLLESGGDNLAADFSRELADFSIYVIDTCGGEKIPRKGGPGITLSDVLIVNKTDLADHVGASLDVMKRDADVMRGVGPTVFCQVKFGVGVDEVVRMIEEALSAATAASAALL